MRPALAARGFCAGRCSPALSHSAGEKLGRGTPRERARAAQAYDAVGDTGGADYPVTDLLQMMGRASRPDIDDSGRRAPPRAPPCERRAKRLHVRAGARVASMVRGRHACMGTQHGRARGARQARARACARHTQDPICSHRPGRATCSAPAAYSNSTAPSPGRRRAGAC